MNQVKVRFHFMRFFQDQNIKILDENDELKKRVKFLEQQNRNLMSQLRKLQESVMSVSV